MNCMIYPLFLSMRKPYIKCVKRYPTTFITTHDLGFFLPNSRTGHILYEKVRKRNIPWMNFMGLPKLREQQL